ncbi:MAG: glycosyltransferase [Candidatus Krumholzibacteria bacterium]|nr:glycosyltransferase [Candidatus Krumholzibacteria bacterium]
MKIVCFSEIQWRYVRTRKQQILTRFPPDCEILFLSSVVRGRRNNLLPERDGRVTHLCVPAMKNFPQAWARALFAAAPVRLLWNALLWFWVWAVRCATGFSGGGCVFYVSNIYYAAVLRLMPRALLLYDCNDDPLAFPDAPAWARGYFSRLARMADVVVAVTSGLRTRLENAGAAEVRLLGNGVDYELFERAAAGPTPDEMAGLPRPVIGYVGAVAHWFDFDLVERVAAEHPAASVVIIGPVFRGLEERAAGLRAARSNVVFLGERPYERLGAYCAAMDVCMIPLAMNELRRLADPNKIYEYAAAGRPIVTLAYSEEIAALSGLLHVARTPAEFVGRIGEALRDGGDPERLKAFARSRSWQSRADGMMRLIREGLDRKRRRSGRKTA